MWCVGYTNFKQSAESEKRHENHVRRHKLFKCAEFKWISFFMFSMYPV